MLPVVVLVGFNAIVPLMTVVNYSVQETFGNNRFFLAGVEWFEEVAALGPLLRRALRRQLLFTAHRAADRDAARHGDRPRDAAPGPWVSACLVLMSLPLLIPWNVVGAIWNIFALPDIGLLGWALNAIGIDYNYTRQPSPPGSPSSLMDVWHWTSLVALLCYAGLSLDPRRLLPGGQDRRRLGRGRSSATSSCRR